MAGNNFEEKIGSPIPLSRRITEIMDSKRVSIRALQARLEFLDENGALNRETIRRIMNGDRPCRPSEAKLIAQALKITDECLRQTDTVDLLSDICRSIERKNDLNSAKKLCEYYNSIAIGLSEKCDALNYLAHINADLGNYEEAHKIWLNAFELVFESCRNSLACRREIPARL